MDGSGRTLAVEFQVKYITNSHVDNTQKALISPLELALIKYLNCNNGRFLDSAVYLLEVKQ